MVQVSAMRGLNSCGNRSFHMFDYGFYKGKKVLITGHTGFKGTWMCHVLKELEADVVGYALKAPTHPSLFELTGVEKEIQSFEGDIRDLENLKQVFEQTKPEIVIHMAAQPIVRESYLNPVCTYETNVMGTVNVLECVRQSESVKSFVNVTTDKVYLNKEWEWGYREGEELNGFDPYSNSKSCSELVTSCYQNSFFADKKVAISTARAGNVIGGGDFAKDRILPDCLRAVEEGNGLVLRNPQSTRPYQHVLEPIFAYLLIAAKQYEDIGLAGNYNVGPKDESCVSTQTLVDEFCTQWNQCNDRKITWHQQGDGGPHEANFLKLDCSKIKKVLGFEPRWNYVTMLEKTVEWMQVYLEKQDVVSVMKRQVQEYMHDFN